MNIFIIPSWFPSHKSSVSGVFIKEQALALADLNKDHNIIVSTWGQGDNGLPIRPSRRMIDAITWRIKQRRDIFRFHNNYWEIFNPKLEWSKRYPWINSKQLFAVNRKNFLLAQEKIGPIHIIHAHVSYPGGYIAALLSKEFGVPYVMTEHMSPFPFKNLMRNGYPMPEITYAFSQARASIAVSASLAERVASFGYTRPKIIPNMVDERAFDVGEPLAGRTIFFTLCCISEQKGIDYLLDAIAMWNPPASEVEFRIAGDGPQLAAYQAKATELGLDDRVRWLGTVSREDAPAMFQACHIYVMPSRHETFGVVYAEAIACGKPIIATRCGGPESIVNSSNGLLVDIGDVKSLAQAMQKIAVNWNKYSSQDIRNDFEKRFSRHAVSSKLYALYDEILRK